MKRNRTCCETQRRHAGGLEKFAQEAFARLWFHVVARTSVSQEVPIERRWLDSFRNWPLSRRNLQSVYFRGAKADVFPTLLAQGQGNRARQRNELMRHQIFFDPLPADR